MRAAADVALVPEKHAQPLNCCWDTQRGGGSYDANFVSRAINAEM